MDSLGGQIEIYNEEVGGAAVHITLTRESLTSLLCQSECLLVAGCYDLS